MRGKINAAAGIASLMEMPPSPGKPDLPFEKHVLTAGPGRRFLEWLNSQDCVAGARVPVVSAEGRTAYGMLTSDPGQVRVDYELKVLDAGGGDQVGALRRLSRDSPRAGAAAGGVTHRRTCSSRSRNRDEPGQVSPGSGRAPC